MPFLGMPLIFVGGAMLQYAYMGTVARYAAGELAPVATDTVNYMAEGSAGGVQTISRAIGEGLAEGMAQGGGAAPGEREAAQEEDRGTVRERLEELDALRDEGLIDEQDYEEQKDRILDDL